MFLVPTDTPGVDMVRHIGLAGESEDEGMHALIHYEDVRVPAENLLGGEGQAFAIAQTRLGGGRVHHAMRTVATCQRALDLLCERVLSRETQGSLLARKQFIQGDIADSYAELAQFRLLVLYTAWEIDQVQGLPADPQEHRRHQGPHPQGRPRRRLALHARPRRARRVQRDALRRHVDDGAHHERGRRADRGPQGHRGPRGPEGLRARRRACGPRPTCRPTGGGPPEAGRPTSSTSSATPEPGRCVPPAARQYGPPVLGGGGGGARPGGR